MRTFEQFAQRILPLLCGAADRVEETEIFLRKLGSVSIDHCLPNATLHFLGLAAQHRGLICYANGLQMHVGIESGRMRAFEFLEERVFVAAVPDIIANVIGIRESQNDDDNARCRRRARANWWPWSLRARPCRE